MVLLSLITGKCLYKLSAVLNKQVRFTVPFLLLLSHHAFCPSSHPLLWSFPTSSSAVAFRFTWPQWRYTMTAVIKSLQCTVPFSNGLQNFCSRIKIALLIQSLDTNLLRLLVLRSKMDCSLSRYYLCMYMCVCVCVCVCVWRKLYIVVSLSVVSL